MNKKLIYVVVAVVVVAGVAFYINQAGTPMGGSPVAQSPMSMKDLLANSASQKCTFSNSIAGNESSGVVYTSGGRMRGDFMAKMATGETVESHMIVTGETTYIWNNQMQQGMKIGSNMMNNSQAGAQPNGGVDINEKINYNCSKWSTDQNQFSLPSGITFTDLSAILPTGN